MDCILCPTRERCNAERALLSIAVQKVNFYIYRIAIEIDVCEKRNSTIHKQLSTIDKVIMELLSLDQTKDVAHFLNAGQMCLNMANILHEHRRQHKQKMSTIYTIILKVINIYSKLKIRLSTNLFDEEFNSQEEDFDDPKICFFCTDETYYHQVLLAIKSKIPKFVKLYALLMRYNLTLYKRMHLILIYYCLSVRQFLHAGNTSITKLQQKSLRNDYHSYYLLEQMLKHVSKAQEYVVRYVDIIFKEEVKFNN